MECALINSYISGGLAERFIASVLKTEEPKGSVGSNPTPSSTLHSDSANLCDPSPSPGDAHWPGMTNPRLTPRPLRQRG